MYPAPSPGMTTTGAENAVVSAKTAKRMAARLPARTALFVVSFFILFCPYGVDDCDVFGARFYPSRTGRRECVGMCAVRRSCFRVRPHDAS